MKFEEKIKGKIQHMSGGEQFGQREPVQVSDIETDCLFKDVYKFSVMDWSAWEELSSGYVSKGNEDEVSKDREGPDWYACKIDGSQ